MPASGQRTARCGSAPTAAACAVSKTGSFPKSPRPKACRTISSAAWRRTATGNFWISSHDGIFRVVQKELNDCADGEPRTVDCLTYGKGDGLPSLECSGGLQPSACRTGRTAGSGFPPGGVVVVNPGNDQNQPPAAARGHRGSRCQRQHCWREDPQYKPPVLRFRPASSGLNFISPD